MEKLWTTAEVARYLGVNEADVEQLVQAGTLTGYKLGGCFLRFRPEQVKALKLLEGPRPPAAGVEAPARLDARGAGKHEPTRWQEHVRDVIYFYDFYIVSALLLIGLVCYLLSSS
jgi:excisionase family DNA binding protein